MPEDGAYSSSEKCRVSAEVSHIDVYEIVDEQIRDVVHPTFHRRTQQIQRVTLYQTLWPEP